MKWNLLRRRRSAQSRTCLNVYSNNCSVKRIVLLLSKIAYNLDCLLGSYTNEYSEVFLLLFLVLYKRLRSEIINRTL